MKNSQLVHPYLDQAYSCIKNIYRWDILFRVLEVGGPSQRDQRGMGPAVCWNWGEWGLKEYKWNGSFLVCSFELVVPVQEIFILFGCSVQASTKICPHRTLLQFLCPHRPATWAGSRAGPPVYECVSPDPAKQGWSGPGGYKEMSSILPDQ